MVVKPEVGHLRIFGFLVYIHVPKEKRMKLEPSGKKGIFVGYSDLQRPTKLIFQDLDRLNLAGM